MLLQNDKHKKYHEVGPKDITWPAKEDTVAMIQVTKQTIDSEQWNFSIPVSKDDTRESLDTRIGMMLSFGQERMEDANAAWVALDEQRKSEEVATQEAVAASKKKKGK